MDREKEIEKLIRDLKDKDPNVRYNAAWAIGEIAEKGGDCSEAVTYLIEALKDKSKLVRREAAEALEKIGFDNVPMESRVLAL
ncbi:MAG: HEAT repeat domain-containing protein, partial [Candidatus Anstonellales archaeon]